MDPKIKKIAIFVICIVAVFATINFLRRPKTIQELSQNTPQINFTTNTKDNLPIEIEDEVNLQTPQKLSPISYSYKELTPEEMKRVAGNVGFNFEATKIEDAVEGVKYLWSNDNSSLWITPKISHLKYSKTNAVQTQISNRLTEEELKKVSAEFLISKFNINGANVLATTVNYMQKGTSEETGFIKADKNNAQIVQVNFNYKNSNYPILTNNPQFPIVFVLLQPSGEIIGSEAHLLEKITLLESSYNIKDMNDIENSLPQAKLISVENAFIDIGDIETEKITSLKVENAELAYLFDKKSDKNLLIPIYLLMGTINIEGSPANYARLYIPAYK